MSDGELEGERAGLLGIRAVTEVFVDRQGINYDDLLLARTCRRCGQLIYDADVTDVSGGDALQIIVRTRDARMYVLRGSEMLTARCACGGFCAIVVYGPALHDGAGYMAFTVVELNGLSERLAATLRDMRRLGDAPAEAGEWISGETVRGIRSAVRLTGKRELTCADSDWCESRYSSGWVCL